MMWNSPAEFFAMGGYGLYVWGSFGVCALALVIEPWLVKQRYQSIVTILRRQSIAEAAEKLEMDNK
jgi:heme exporter protein D